MIWENHFETALFIAFEKIVTIETVNIGREMQNGDFIFLRYIKKSGT